MIVTDNRQQSEWQVVQNCQSAYSFELNHTMGSQVSSRNDLNFSSVLLTHDSSKLPLGTIIIILKPTNQTQVSTRNNLLLQNSMWKIGGVYCHVSDECKGFLNLICKLKNANDWTVHYCENVNFPGLNNNLKSYGCEKSWWRHSDDHFYWQIKAVIVLWWLTHR